MALTTAAEVIETMQSGTLYSNEQIQPAVDASIALIQARVTTEAFDDEPAALKVAATGLAVDIFQSQTTSGGQAVDPTFAISPFKLGRSLTSRFEGLLAPYLDAGTFVG